MLSLEPWTLFWTVFNVIVLFLGLKKFLIKPVRSVIDQRENMIEQQFLDARNAQRAAETMKKEYEEELVHAKEEAAEIITAARTRAGEEHEQMMAETREESGKLLQQAKKEIQCEQEQAMQEMKSQIAVLAMSAAKKIIETGDGIHDAGGNQSRDCAL